MKKYIAGTLLILGFLLPKATKAQQEDITGVWNGYLELMDSANNPVKLPYEIAVSEEKGKLTGYSRIIFHANGKDEAGMQGIVLKWKGKEIIIEDEGFVEHEFSINPSKRVKKTMVMTLTLTETEMIMEGSWSTNRTKTYIQMKGNSILKRKNDFKSSALFKRLDTLKIAEKLSFKDRPETAPVVAIVTPVEKKPETAPAPQPAPEPELVVPAIGATGPVDLVAVEKKQQPAAKILPPSKQKKMQLDALAKTVIKPAPKPVAPPVKPEPVVAVAEPKPKPEKKVPPPPAPKPEPVVVKKAAPAPAPETKPEPVVVKPAPKPPPAPVAVVAPSVTQGAAELDKRVTKSDKEYYFDSDSLVLTLYDNGEVDGDTVTVIMNGGIIFSKTRLTEKPNTKTIYINSNMDSVKLVMYAESLGEIPPNTGLLVVMDGEKRYDVRFSADLKTNAAIILRRRKEQ